MNDDAGETAERHAGRTGFGGHLTYAQTVLVLCSLGWFLVQSGRLILPALALPIQRSLGIGNAEFGVAVSVLWGVYALLQFPGGIASDDLGYRTMLVFGSVVTAAGYLLLVGVPNYPAFVVAAALLGVGVGSFYISSRTYPSEVYGDAKGRALGIANAAGDVGGVVAPLAAGAITALALPWRSAFAVIGGLVLLVGVAFHRAVPGEYALRRPALRSAGTAAVDRVATRSVLITLLAYCVFALAWQGSTAFIPLYVYEGKNLSYEVGTLMLSLFFLMGVVVKPLTGAASDVVGRRVLATGSLLASGVFLVGLAVVDGRLAVVAFIALFGATLMMFPPVTQAYLIEQFPADDVGGAFGLSRTGYVLVGSLGPALVGVGSETVGYDVTFAAFGVGLVAAGVVLAVFTGPVPDDRTERL